MTNEEILKQQIDALEKLLQLKEAVIEAQEERLQRLSNELEGTRIMRNFPQMPNINIPSLWVSPTPDWQCADGQPHDYPNPWGGTTPPSCSKCGRQPTNGSLITSTFTSNSRLDMPDFLDLLEPPTEDIEK